ncbi:MAG TPA: hypothetical protein VHC40_07685 [Rhizomicrobium sp.]|jgi:Flp pilus assembly CpaE family ATPase|nr:hypothetical protein [Rhizomicrobium sp.]
MRHNLLLMTGDLALGERLRAAFGNDCAVLQVNLRQHDENVARRFDPQAVIIDASADTGTHTVLERIAEVRRQHPQVPLIVIGDEMSAQLILAAFRAGADDFMDREAPDAELYGSVMECLRAKAASPGARGAATLVNIFSPAPCEEDCDLALNIASLVAQESRSRVLLLDLSWPATPLSAALGLDFDFSVRDAIRDMTRLDQAFLDSALARAAGAGLHVLPLAEGADELPPLRDLAVLLEILRALFDTVVVCWGVLSHQAARAGLAGGHAFVCCNQRFSSIRNARAFLSGLRAEGREHAPVLALHLFDAGLSPDANGVAEAVGAERCMVLRAQWSALAAAHNRGRPLALCGPSGYGDALRSLLTAERLLPQVENSTHRFLHWLGRAG